MTVSPLLLSREVNIFSGQLWVYGSDPCTRIWVTGIFKTLLSFPYLRGLGQLLGGGPLYHLYLARDSWQYFHTKIRPPSKIPLVIPICFEKGQKHIFLQWIADRFFDFNENILINQIDTKITHPLFFSRAESKGGGLFSNRWYSTPR